ncbi:MAG TPA: hypothetical protein VFX16_10220 [Pseudonocardiaceae bacterium]|nr:hypothetical protein [Pseudonocardiaceae bacterium]
MGVEIEIGLTVGRRLAGRDVTPEQAKAAVDTVHPAFELVTRPSNWSPAACRARTGHPSGWATDWATGASCSVRARTRHCR